MSNGSINSTSQPDVRIRSLSVLHLKHLSFK